MLIAILMLQRANTLSKISHSNGFDCFTFVFIIGDKSKNFRAMTIIEQRSE